MKARNIILVLFAFFMATTAFAQKSDDAKVKNETIKPTIFAIKADYRTRFESTPMYSKNMLAPEKTPLMNLLGQRARLIVCYKSKKIETKLSFQDVRYFGQNKTVGQIWSSTNGAAFAVHQAWAKYNFVNNENRKLGLKIGRQELDFADERLMGNRDWLLQGSAFDAVNLQCDNKEFSVKWDLGFAYNSVDAIGTASPYRFLAFANISKKFGDIATLNVTNLYEDKEQDKEFKDGKQDSTYYTNTIGLNPVIKKSGIKFDASFYYQLGEQAVLSNSIGAMMYTANLSYTLDKKYCLGVGYDNYSGRAYDDTTDLDVNKAFNSPYAYAHKFFGATDFHTALFDKGFGLQDINVKIGAKITKEFMAKAEFHVISFANKAMYMDGANTVEFTSIGNNFDLMLAYKLTKGASIKLGYSLMMPSDDFVHYSLGNINAAMHNFAWVMFVFKPKLFMAKK